MTGAFLHHVQVNVAEATTALPFYRALLGHLGFRPVHDADEVAGFPDGRTDLWIVGTPPPHGAAGFHPKRPGLNHGTPRDFPAYAPGYRAVFFEGPDRLKLEVVHRPAHA